AVSARQAASWLGCSGAPATNRRFPAISASKASSGVGVGVSVMPAGYGRLGGSARPGAGLLRKDVRRGRRLLTSSWRSESDDHVRIVTVHHPYRPHRRPGAPEVPRTGFGGSWQVIEAVLAA